MLLLGDAIAMIHRLPGFLAPAQPVQEHRVKIAAMKAAAQHSQPGLPVFR